MLGAAQLNDYSEKGFLVAREIASSEACGTLLDRAGGLSASAPGRGSGVVLRYEDDFAETLAPQQKISKLYRLHRDPAFWDLCQTGPIPEIIASLIGPDVDLFLSQVVFKLPGAFGQPWHQDASIFPFEPSRPVVGVWIALTEAGRHRSCLEVKAGSHRSGLLSHGRQASAPTKGRYVALLDPPVIGTETIEFGPGDGIVFDSHLVHASTDNTSDQLRVAAVAHFAMAGTVDRTTEVFGINPFNDWLPFLRGATVVART